MNDRLVTKLSENFLHDCKKRTIDKQERAEVIKKLLFNKKCSLQKLADELGISKSTLHDWVSQRQDKKDRIAINFGVFYQKILSLDPKDITDWGRLEQIKQRIEFLQRKKK